MIKKQTAVEWFAEYTSQLGYVSVDILEQAIEKEKQQIIDAHGVKTESINQDQSKIVTGNQYYNKTFKQG